jgi:hypothetical protein
MSKQTTDKKREVNFWYNIGDGYGIIGCGYYCECGINTRFISPGARCEGCGEVITDPNPLED